MLDFLQFFLYAYTTVFIGRSSLLKTTKITLTGKPLKHSKTSIVGAYSKTQSVKKIKKLAQPAHCLDSEIG